MMKKRKLSHLALSDNGFLFDSTTGHTYTLNSTGTFVLRKLIDDIPFEQIIAEIKAEYDTTDEELSRDLNQFVNFLSKLGIVEEM